ncbi:hypothetical protein [Paenibacillus sp. GCM10027626]|uniref:hypothetical protein n=1 Tax=Paenibacillus sp. GCM10027626 TaxID=3273411 RepID=UPI0036439B70
MKLEIEFSQNSETLFHNVEYMFIGIWYDNDSSEVDMQAALSMGISDYNKHRAHCAGKGGKATMGRKRGIRRQCSLEGCEGQHYAIGLCKKHYYVNYYYLNPRKRKAEQPKQADQPRALVSSPQERSLN